MIEISEKSRALGELLAKDLGNGRASYKLYLGRAYATLRNFHEAEDFVSDFYLKAINKAGLYRYLIIELNDRQLGGWLNSVFRNLIIDYLKKRKERCFQDIDELLYEKKAIEESLSERIIMHEKVEKLRRGIEMLPAKYKEITILYDLMENTGKEVAEITGEKFTTVRGRVSISRKILRRNLELVEA